MSDLPRARVKQSLADLIPKFLSNRRADIAMLKQHLAPFDATIVKSVGHRLKGAGAGYGFAEISTLGAAIEGAALRGEAHALGAMIDELEHYLDTVVIEYL